MSGEVINRLSPGLRYISENLQQTVVFPLDHRCACFNLQFKRTKASSEACVPILLGDEALHGSYVRGIPLEDCAAASWTSPMFVQVYKLDATASSLAHSELSVALNAQED